MSTSSALANLLSSVYESYEKYIANVNCYLLKAFDLVNHDRFLNKFEYYMIRGSVLNLLVPLNK